MTIIKIIARTMKLNISVGLLQARENVIASDDWPYQDDMESVIFEGSTEITSSMKARKLVIPLATVKGSTPFVPNFGYVLQHLTMQIEEPTCEPRHVGHLFTWGTPGNLRLVEPDNAVFKTVLCQTTTHGCTTRTTRTPTRLWMDGEPMFSNGSLVLDCNFIAAFGYGSESARLPLCKVLSIYREMQENKKKRKR